MSTDLVKIENIGDVLSQLETSFYNIPFENSEFQTMVFVLAAQQTPARAYRALGLRMFSKIQAVKEHLFNRKKIEIDLAEKRFTLTDPKTSTFDRQRIELDIAKIEDGYSFGDKLLNDSINELNVLWREFKKFPRYTREQFEAEERHHFELRLKRQMEHGGASESLENMNTDARSIERAIAEAKVMLGPDNHFQLGS